MRRALPSRLIKRLSALLILGAGSLGALSSVAPAQSIVLFGGATPRPSVLYDVAVAVRGSLVVSFHGDQGSGCEEHGLCGYSGTVAWTPPSSGILDVLASGSHGRDTYQAGLDLIDLTGFGPGTGAVTNARVSFTAPGAASPSSTCADAADSNGVALDLPVDRQRVTFTLEPLSPSAIQTRCAGPLMSDLARVLHTQTLLIGQVLHGHRTVDLSGSGSFDAGGFAGSVTSTLSFVLGSSRRTSLIAKPKPKPKTSNANRERFAEVTYRASVTGTVVEHLAGAPQPGQCQPLGSCGAAGTVILRADGTTSSAGLSANGPAARPDRDFLAALGLSKRGNPRGLFVGGFVTFDSGGALSEDLNPGFADACQDGTTAPSGYALLMPRGRKLEVSYTSEDVQGVGELRTRCPGPMTTMGAVATAQLPVGALARRRLTIHLHAVSPFAGDGYTGSVDTQVTLTLTRLRVRFETEPANITTTVSSSSASG